MRSKRISLVIAERSITGFCGLRDLAGAISPPSEERIVKRLAREWYHDDEPADK